MSKAIETQKTKLCVNGLTETVSITFKSSNGALHRAAGDWTADGIVAGTVLSTSSTHGNKGPFIAKTVTAMDITIDQGASRVVQGFAIALVAGSSLSTVLKAGLPVSEMTTFSGFDGAASSIDTTSMDSTSKEFLMGLRNNGQFKGDFNFIDDDPGQMALIAAIGTRKLTPFQLRMSNNGMFEFSGFVSSRPITGGVDAKADTNFTILISGDVTYDPKFVTGT